MHQIWTNPSLQRSFIQTTANKSELLNYLKVSFINSLEQKCSDVLIFTNMEYDFVFYDANTGKKQSIRALVTDIYEDQIKIKYSPKAMQKKCLECEKYKTCENVNKSNIEPMPTCGCILNPPDVSVYDDVKIYFIPIMNLISVSYVKTNTDNNINHEGEIRVMLLGISATIVKAIVVRLDFFDDSIEDAVKYVELEANNIYDITYESNDGSIYESRVKVIRIEEVKDECICKPGSGFVREHVGMHNSVYCICKNDKSDFMSQPPVKKIRIVVDTSESFTGRYECIMLDTIRDCKLVGVDDTTEIPNVSCCDGCKYKTESCDIYTCGHYVHKDDTNKCMCNSELQKYTYTYDNCMKATVEGESVLLNIKGEEHSITLDSLLKYYLGVE